MPVHVEERPANTGVFPARDHFPLGRLCGVIDGEPEPASAARPFGLTRAQPPREVGQLNPDDLSYNDDAQVGLIREGDRMIKLAKHSTGQTNTQTNNDGHQGYDSDTDHTED
ncbi:MAG: putative ATP-grasp-modified RiPP [Haloechinothrix sp.]